MRGSWIILQCSSAQKTRQVILLGHKGGTSLSRFYSSIEGYPYCRSFGRAPPHLTLNHGFQIIRPEEIAETQLNRTLSATLSGLEWKADSYSKGRRGWHETQYEQEELTRARKKEMSYIFNQHGRVLCNQWSQGLWDWLELATQRRNCTMSLITLICVVYYWDVLFTTM